MAPYPQLHIYEAITLLALKDKAGTVSIPHLAQILAGSLAAELILLDKFSVETGKKKFVDLLDTSPTGTPLLDECIEKVATAKRRAQLNRWISRFASIKRLHHRAAESLCQKGILQKSTNKVLFLFNRTVYPELDPIPEQRLINRMESAIFSDREDLSPEDVIVVSLADTVGLLDKLFGRKKLKPYKKRLKLIAEGSVAAKATREVIQAIQVAIIASTTAATAVAAGS